MPDPITYSPAFEHRDWIDNEDVVQAGGEDGFNRRFNELRAELDRIASVFGLAEGAVQALETRIDEVEALAREGVAVTPVSQFDAVMNPGAFSGDQTVEAYPVDENRRIYHAAVQPLTSRDHAQVTPLFAYREESGQVTVTVQMKNESTEDRTRVRVQVSRVS